MPCASLSSLLCSGVLQARAIWQCLLDQSLPAHADILGRRQRKDMTNILKTLTAAARKAVCGPESEEDEDE